MGGRSKVAWGFAIPAKGKPIAFLRWLLIRPLTEQVRTGTNFCGKRVIRHSLFSQTPLVVCNADSWPGVPHDSQELSAHDLKPYEPWRETGNMEEAVNIAAAVIDVAFAIAVGWLVSQRMKSSRIATLLAVFGLFAAVAAYALEALSHYPRPTSLEIALFKLSVIICPPQLLLLMCPDCDIIGWWLVITYSMFATLNAGLYVLIADGIMKLRKSRRA